MNDMHITEIKDDKSNKKTLTGKEVIDLFEDTDAVIINDFALSFPSVESDDEFTNIDISYQYEGLTYDYKFNIWNDDEYVIIGNQIILANTNDHAECEIKLLTVKLLMKDVNI